jgi:hypothetical protein
MLADVPNSVLQQLARVSPMVAEGSPVSGKVGGASGMYLELFVMDQVSSLSNAINSTSWYSPVRN